MRYSQFIRLRYMFSAFLSLILISWPSTAFDSDLQSKVVIRRDSYGIPHILAESEESAAFAHGYVTAEDHFSDLTHLILRARGEQASIFGEARLQEDRLIRQLGIWETARSHFDEIPPLMQAILNAYADGYNLYLSKHKADAPEWARPISGVDVLALSRAILLIDFSLDLRPWRHSQSSSGTGSNMWAIGRTRSQSGLGILLANPHLGWTHSALFHEVQITVPGKINVIGAALVGAPVVSIGFNDYLGWAHTVNQCDSDDVYELTLTEDKMHYLYDKRPLPLKRRTFSYQMKTDRGIETRTEETLTSHYGPIIRVEGKKAYAYKSANLSLINFLTQYNLMAKSNSLAEFRAALNLQELPMFNVAYADRGGNILYLFNGRIPIRSSGYNWSGIIPGDTSKSEWYAIHPISELPQMLNPKSGYIQNCNDAPWYVNLEQSLQLKDFPDYFSREKLGWRGQTSLQILEAEKSFTLEKIMRLKFNDTVALADRVKQELLRLARNRLSDFSGLDMAVDVLEQWDNRATPDSTGTLLFLEWWRKYSKSVPNPFRVGWTPEQPLTTPNGIANPEQAISSLSDTASLLKERFGRVAVPWGLAHRVRRGEIDLPIGGSPFSLHTIYSQQGKDGLEFAVGGDSYILAVEFTSPPTAFSVLAYSQSAKDGTKHYSDQTRIFAEGRMRPLWITEEDIQKNLERSYRPGE